MATELCIFVIERATEGPCVVMVYFGFLIAGESDGPLFCNVEDDDHKTGGSHEWLGPVLARCEHEEHLHVFTGPSGLSYCALCPWETDLHPFTIEETVPGGD